jgi:nitrite reductase (NO-forming)
MTNAGGMHDLVIDELGVKTPVVKTAEAATATFSADKVGSFVYYCDVANHKEKGMWGTLVVQ